MLPISLPVSLNVNDIGFIELVELVEYVMDNNIEEVDETDFARGLKFAVLPLILKREPHATAFGYGVGMYKGGSLFEKSKFAKQYNWLLQGTIMQAFLFMIELGWVGLGWYVLFWILNFRVQNKAYRNKQLQLYMLLTIIVISIYSCNFIIVPFQNCVGSLNPRNNIIDHCI